MMIILQQLEGMGEHCKLPHWGFGDQNVEKCDQNGRKKSEMG